MLAQEARIGLMVSQWLLGSIVEATIAGWVGAAVAIEMEPGIRIEVSSPVRQLSFFLFTNLIRE